MARTDRQFTAALGYRWLTPLYDRAVKLMGGEDRWRGAFVRQIRPRDRARICELGCGTGSLTVRLKQAGPATEVVGLDPDPAALERAKGKAEEARAPIAWVEGFADAPPDDQRLEAGSFDAVVSALVFHHLRREGKRGALKTAHRLLRPGGELFIADWAEARTVGQRLAFLTIQFIDGFETTTDNIKGQLPEFIREAGFSEAEEIGYWHTRYGPFAFYRAVKPPVA